MKNNMSLIKNENQIQLMREAGRIVALVQKKLKEIIVPGVSLLELDKISESIILKEGGEPVFKGYGGFPNSICASVNDAMIHGIPSEYEIKNGDVVKIDVGVIKNGWNGDAAFTISVGEISERTQSLINTTKEALMSAIAFSKPGITLGELGAHIESFAIKNGFTSTKKFVGHGIGKKMHEDPNVPNYASNSSFVLKENMCLAIEPMFIDGKDELFIDPYDKWTVRTKHGGMTTHEEHTIVIKKNGGEILTKL